MKNLSGMSIKLNGSNFLLWSQAFQTFIGAHRKTRHLTADPPEAKDSAYDDWFADDCVVISQLVNSMEEDVSRDVMMLRPVKKIWNTL